jgi:putative intracellular protease/amidase
MMATVLMLLASERFRDCEYLVPRAFFEQANIEVITSSTSKFVKGRFGYTIEVDFLLENIDAQKFDGIFFVGGGGAVEYAENMIAKKLFGTFLSLNKPVAAICAAPRNLLKWGYLKNKKCTGFDSDGVFSQLALENGAIPLPEEFVVRDGNILTANGPEASEACALVFIDLIKNNI